MPHDIYSILENWKALQKSPLSIKCLKIVKREGDGTHDNVMYDYIRAHSFRKD